MYTCTYLAVKLELYNITPRKSFSEYLKITFSDRLSHVITPSFRSFEIAAHVKLLLRVRGLNVKCANSAASSWRFSFLVPKPAVEKEAGSLSPSFTGCDRRRGRFEATEWPSGCEVVSHLTDGGKNGDGLSRWDQERSKGA